MGVPKFYRWVSERYPCLSETVKEFQVRNVLCIFCLLQNAINKACCVINCHGEEDRGTFAVMN